MPAWSDEIATLEQEVAVLRQKIESLRPLAEEYQLMVENIRDYALIPLDPENRISGWSKGAEKMLGFQAHEVLGKPGALLFTPEDIEKGEPEREAAVASREGRVEDERWHRKKDGSRFWGSGVMTAMRTASGQLRGYYKIIRDLTAHRQAEEAVRQSEEKLRRFVENVTDHALIQVDLQSNITGWNRGAERIFGYTEKEILHHPVGILFSPEDRAAQIPETDLAITRAEGRFESERMLVRKDHSRFVARWVTTPIRDENRSLLGFAKVLRDETERRKAEERLRASLNERDTLLKEIHHRVKNNLQVITSLLSLQSDQISDPRALAMFNDTQSRVRAIAKIHETLYSSVDLANIEFEQYTRALVQDLIAFYNIDPARIQLELNTDDIVLDITQAIPLGLILNELVVNCFKHAFPGDHRGRVEISLRYLDESVGPGQTLDEGKAQLCVEDTGVGMPPDFAFEQAESMGMYLVRILTRQLNGTATLDQTRSTRICVTFPLTLDDAGAVQ